MPDATFSFFFCPLTAFDRALLLCNRSVLTAVPHTVLLSGVQCKILPARAAHRHRLHVRPRPSHGVDGRRRHYRCYLLAFWLNLVLLLHRGVHFTADGNGR